MRSWRVSRALLNESNLIEYYLYFKKTRKYCFLYTAGSLLSLFDYAS